jgi:hypothetical protein
MKLTITRSSGLVALDVNNNQYAEVNYGTGGT